jgi:cytochrome P450/NADPH-cytochrome P450 reductase
MKLSSISSSPLYNPTNVSVTFSVLSSPSLSGRGSYLGVATSYLNSLAEGDTVHVSIRPSHAGFSLPSNPETIPLLCIAAGTGIAPFRSFFQERASMISSGRTLAPAILFFGCRAPGIDDLYREEMDAWEKAGVVKVRRSYSRKPEESNGCKYVQDKMWKDREVVAKYWEDGAKVYVCGSRAIADGAKTMFLKIKSTMEDQKQLDEAAAEKWFTSLRNIRYVTDVFD